MKLFEIATNGDKDYSNFSDSQLDLMAKFGVGPKYVPPAPDYRTCSKCGYDKARLRERHADTDMNYMAIDCPECGHEKEI